MNSKVGIYLMWIIRRPVVAFFVPVCLFLTACDMPLDPENTFDRASQNVIRIGLTEQSPWIIIKDKQYSGTEVQLVEAFGQQLGARIDWHEGSESVLLEALERYELDMVIGGLKKSIPWKSVGFTRPYYTKGDDEHVMAVPLGENRWLLELERFLQGKAAQEIIQ